MSQHIWIAEVQDVSGNAIAYHGVDLVPEAYVDKVSWNAAHRSWYWFRQRERKNLKCNRPPKSKIQLATHWFQPDDILFQMESPGVTYHKTIWDLYEAIGYDIKLKRYTDVDRVRGHYEK